MITQIRRNKIGASAHVTPNEFRYTLIKFGVILAQPLVDKIFSVFDSDRSGTMDFDEFAMWIMNSEFKPVQKNVHKQSNLEDEPEEKLRKKFKVCIEQFPEVFKVMKKKISFLEFMSDITRKDMQITEREGREIFLKFDPNDTGYIDTPKLISWGTTGIVAQTPRVATSRRREIPSLKESIAKVSGNNTRQMERAFSHILPGKGTKVSIEEFRRCLLEAGLGRNKVDTMDLFMNLGGASGMADIDLLFSNLTPMPIDLTTAVSLKPQPSAAVSSSRADRRLREALRISFKEVKNDLEAADKANTGYVDIERLHKIITHRCVPITFQDLRWIVSKIHTENGGSRVNWHHLLHMYNPRKAPHQLSGISSIPEFIPLHHDAPQTDANSTMGGTSSLSSSQSLSSINNSNNNNNNNNSNSNSINNKPDRKPASNVSSDLRKVWHAVLKDCHKADTERSGFVSRDVFIMSMMRANATPQSIGTLIEKHGTSDGKVDYLGCFRAFLSLMVGDAPIPKPESKFETVDMHKSRNIRALHPWEFDYKKDKHSGPYWRQATSMPKEVSAQEGNLALQVVVPPPSEKSAADLSAKERDLLLSQYSTDVLDACRRLYNAIPQATLKTLKNEFKRTQIISQRGSILTQNFLLIIEGFGIKVSKKDINAIIKAFRGLGMQDVVKFDELFRVCSLLKSMG